MITVGFQVRGEDDLIRPHGRGRGGLLHPLHHGGDGLADGEAALLDGAEHVHSGLGVAGGVLAVEVVGVEIGPALGDPGLVHRGELAGDLLPIAVSVHIAQTGGDLHGGLADGGGAVGPKTDGVIAAVAAAELALGDHKADGESGVDVVKIAVDARHHTPALGLQLPGHGGDGVPVRKDLAVCDYGRHVRIGRVCNQIFRPEIIVRRAPKGVGGELGLLVQQRIQRRQVLAHGV